MPRPRRNLQAAVTSTLTPPDSLPENHGIARITKAAGNNLYNATTPSGSPILVELGAVFRNTIWIKRGSYVVVDTQALADRENKLDGEIVNVVRDEKEWRKMSYWPKEFEKKASYPEDESSDEESTVGKLPPSSPSDEE